LDSKIGSGPFLDHIWLGEISAVEKSIHQLVF